MLVNESCTVEGARYVDRVGPFKLAGSADATSVQFGEEGLKEGTREELIEHEDIPHPLVRAVLDVGTKGIKR